LDLLEKDILAIKKYNERGGGTQGERLTETKK
jgi:hypothetical protein